jgi:hypothetical protein
MGERDFEAGISVPVFQVLINIFQNSHNHQKAKTYNSRYSLVVTHPTTDLPI